MGYSLYLYPLGSHRSMDRKTLTDFLQQLQCATISDSAGTLIAGPRLMEHITYLGCSPALSSGGSESGIHLHLFDTLTGMGGKSIETLRFPECKHPISAPQTLLASTPDSHWRCEQCGNSGLIKDINWRKSAAYADTFIEVSAIFPKEAIPSEHFILSLQQFTGCDWNWFYSSSSCQ